MVPEVMNSLVKVAYCQAMGGHCNDAVCYLGRTYQRCMEDCCKHDNLGYCSVCKVIMAQYWMHSQGCEDEKCVVPFCIAFKERREEQGDEDFEFVYAYEVVRPSVEILQKLFELTEVQKMQANGRALWDPHYQLTDLMKGAKELTPINYVAPKLGHFGPISCHLKKQGRRSKWVIVSKISFSKDLAATLKSLHRKDPDSQRPALHNIISTCLWYRQVSGDKILVCSQYLSGKTLMSHLDDPVTCEECMLDAVEAAGALHKLNFVYLNWKVDHMMITLNPTHLKLCNFSYAVDLSLGGTVPHHVKTGLDPRIAPPEVVEGRLCVKSDTWGLGCLLHQVLFEGLLPYPDLRHACHKDFLQQRKEPRMDVGEIFRKCWKRNIKERLSTEELCSALVQRFEYQPCQVQGMI
ncbi:uncharacterized protein [Diadema setosum]|uniref:uncharacterized protein n=1 Tax=Diadema setosum TaxID=31175 RepID=UPI003B3AB254